MNYADNGISIIPANFERALVAFATRKSILPSLEASGIFWAREKDVFRRPSEKFQQSAKWRSFVGDCVVYGLFCANANMTALRDFAYHGKKYHVKNEFFYLSVEDVARWAEQHRFRAVEIDAAGAGDAFAYQWLQAAKLSPAATALLRHARAYTQKAFAYRQEYDALHPDYCLRAWDAGWLQQYKMTQSQDALPAAKSALAADYAEFKRLLRALGDQILAAAEADEII
jgi:hypothetical protein